MRGTVAWEDLTRSADQLMPALSPDVDDRPYQRVSSLRKIGFTSGDTGMDHEVPITKQDCIAALVMANLFCDKAARFSLFVMGLAFRARSLESLKIVAPGLSHRFKGKSEEEFPHIFPSFFWFYEVSFLLVILAPRTRTTAGDPLKRVPHQTVI